MITLFKDMFILCIFIEMKKISFTYLFLISLAAYGQNYLPEWRDAKSNVKPKVEVKAYAFNLSDVKLL